MKELIEYLVKHLVDKPGKVSVSEIVGERTVILELGVSVEDMGKVIGRNGQTVSSLRTILNVASAKHGMRSVLELLEENRISS